MIAMVIAIIIIITMKAAALVRPVYRIQEEELESHVYWTTRVM